MIIQIVKFTVQLEHSDAFKAALIDDKKGAEQEVGFLEMRLFVDKNQPHVFFGYVRWKDQAALDAHMKQPYTQKVAELVDTVLQNPVEVMNLGETVPGPLYGNNPNSPNPEDDAFFIFFIFKLKPGFREKVLKQFETHIECTRAEEKGNILFDLYTVDGQDDTLAAYEHWRSETAIYDIHFKQPYAVETGNLLKEAVIGDLEKYMNFITEIG